MTRFSQFRYNRPESDRPATGWGLIGRIIAWLAGFAMLVISVLVGAVFLAGVVGLVLIGSLVVAARLWWLRRDMERQARQSGDIEGDYIVVEERRIRRD